MSHLLASTVLSPTTQAAPFDPRGAIITACFLFACACFILSLKWLSAPATARKGNHIGALGMTAAIAGALGASVSAMVASLPRTRRSGRQRRPSSEVPTS